MIAIAVLPLSYLICAVYVICPVNARVINKRAAFYIANETMCIVDGEVFRNGDPVPTDDHCERCTCRPPGFSCVLRDCEVKPGCKAVRRAGECCPEYVCGCVHSGNIYEDGEIIRDIQNPCYTCRCHGSSISCVFADCLFRGDCVPEYVVSECCPRYDHCPPLSTTPVSTVFTTLFTKTSSPQEDTKNTLITLTTLHLEKFTGDNASISIEDIQFSPSTTSIAESTTLSTTLHDEAKVTVKFSLETTTDSPAEETGSTLLSTLSSWLSTFTTKDSTFSYSGVKDNVSTVQYSEPTVQSSNSTEKYSDFTEKYSDFTEMYSASTEKDSVSTEKDNASTEKYSTFTGKYSESTEKHSESTEKHSESTEKHSESTEKYSDSTKKYSGSTIHTSEPTIHTSEPTVHRLPTSGFTLEYSEPTVHTSESTIQYSEPTVRTNGSTIQYSELTVHSSESTEKYSESTEKYSESTGKYSEPTVRTNGSTIQYSELTVHSSESTEKYSESTEKYSEPTVRTNGSKIQYSELTVHSSESTEKYSESTEKYSESTEKYSESTEKYSESTEKYSESTEKYSESTEKYSESTEEDSESTKKYNESTVGSSEPSVESSRSTIGYGELSVHNSESTEKYGETVHGSEYTEKYNEITVESSAPTVEGSEPKVQTSEPTVEGSEPTAQSSEPTVQGSKLTAQSSEPTLQSSETTLQSSESTLEYSEPTVQSSESTTRNSPAAIYNTQRTRQDSEHIIQDGEPVTKDKESTIQDSEFTTRLVNVSETSESIISTLSSTDSSSTDRTITGISTLWTSSNAATERPITSLDDTKIHINTSSASTIYFEDNITSFEKLSNETVHIITEYVTPALSETISPSILFGEKTYSPNAENDPVEIKTEIPIDISTTQSDVLINDKVALHDDARPEISLATSQEISTTQKTKEKSTTHEATEKSTTHEATEKSTTQGTTEESITYHITEKSTTEGLTETSTTQRTTEKLTTQGPTEKSTVQGTSEKSTIQGTSEKSTIQGTSEKSTIQGTSEKSIDPETTERMKIQEATDNMTTQETAEMMTTYGNTEKMTAQKTPEKIIAQETTGRVITQETTERVLTQETTEKVITQETTERVITQETTERMTTQENREWRTTNQENTEWRTTNQENTEWRTTNQENTEWRTTNQENTEWRTTNQENTKKLTMEPESTEKLALAEESTEKSTTLLIDSKPFSSGGISTSIQGIVTETKEVNRNSEFPISVIVEITSSDSSLKTGSSSQTETSTESTITSRPTITNSDEKIRPRSTTSEEETKTSSGIFKPDRTTSSHSHVDESEIRTTIMFSKLTEKTASTEKTTIADVPKIVDIATTFINDEEFVMSKAEMPDNQSIFTLPTIENEFTTTEILKLEHQNTPKEAISSTFEKAESSMTTKNLEELTKTKTFTKTSILADDETSYFALTETPNEEIKDEKTLVVSLFTASSQLNSVTEEAISNTHTDQVFNLSTIAPQEKSSLKHDATDITEQWPNDTEVDISPIATTFSTLPTIETKGDLHTISTKVFKSPTSETVIDVISSTASQTPHSILEEEAKTYSEEESVETITTDLFDTTHVQTEQFSNPKLASTVAYSAEKDFITEVSLKDKTITSFANTNWMPNNFMFSEDSSTLSTDESTMANGHGLIKDDTTLLADETIADVFTVIADIGKSSTTHHSTIKEEMETDTSPQTTEIIKYLTNKHSTYENAGQTTDSLHENETNDSVFTFEDTMLNSTEKMELESFDFEATYNSTNESILIELDPIEIITDTIISGSSLALITSDVEIEPITEASLMPTLVNEKTNFSTISSESDVSSPSLLHETKIMPDLLTTSEYPLAESEKEITMKSNSTVSPSVKKKTQVVDVFFDVFGQNNLSLSTQKSDELFPRTTKDNDEQLTSISSTDTIETKTLSLTEISKDDIFTAMTTDFEVPTTKKVADTATSFASEEVEGNATNFEHVTSSEKVLPETGSQVAFEISANRSSEMPSVTAVETTHHTMSTIPITEDDSLHIKTDETTSGVELSKTENQYSSIPSNDEHISTKGNPETMYKVTWIATNIATTDKTTPWKTYDSAILTDGETQKADTASEIYLEDYTTDSRKVETNVTPITSFSSDLITDMGDLDPVTNIEHISSESDSSLHADISIRTSKGIDTTTAVPLTTELISAHDRSTSTTSEIEVLFREPPVDKNVSPEVQNLQTKATTHINADKTHDGFSPETTTDIRENTVSTNENFSSTTTIHKRLVLRQTTSASSDTTMFNLPDETSINPNYNHNATSLIIRNVTDGQNIKGSSTTIVEDNDITQASTVTNLSEPTEKLQKDNPHLVKTSSQINNYTPTTYESKQDDNESVNPEDYSSFSSAIPDDFANAESSTDAEQEEAYNSQTTLTSHNAKSQTETGAYSTVRGHTTLGVVHDNELPENETTTNTSSSIFGFDNLPLDDYYPVDYENSNESSVDDILDSINLDRLGESIIIELMKESENTTNRNENETSEYLKDQTDGLNTTQHVSTSPVITEVPTSDSSKESATIDNAHVYAENFHLAIEKEIDNIDNETLHVELNDTANLRGVSDVWYGTETEFESQYTAKEIDVNRSSIDIITDEYIPGNEDGEVLQDDTQRINSSHISEFKNINPNVQKEGKFTTSLYEKSKIITTTEYPSIEENFTKKESHIKSDVEKAVPPNSLNLETTKESVIFKEIGDFITTESPISISSSEYKLKEGIQTTKQSASATITLTENFEDMSTVAPSTMTGIPLQTRNALEKTTGSIGHLTKEDGDSLLIESVSTDMVTDVSTVEIQTTRTDFSESDSTSKFYDSEIMEDHKFQNQDVANVIGSTFTHSDNSEVTTLSLTRTISEEISNETTFYSNENITPSTINLNISVNGEPISLADEETKEGPEKGGEWFEPTLYDKLSNIYETSTTSIKIPQHLTTSESEVADESMTSKLETIHQPTTTVRSAPITYDGIVNGPEKGGEWFEPTFPALLPYNKDSSKEDGKKTQINLTDHLTTESSTFMTEKTNEALSAKTTHMFLSESILLKHDARSTVVEDFEDTFSEWTTETMTPSSILDTNNSQKPSTDKSLFPLPMLHRTQHDKNTLNPVYIKESPEKNINPEVDITQENETPISEKLATTDFETEKAITKPSVASVFPTAYEEVSNETTKQDEIGSSEPTTAINKKLSKIYHILLSKDPASDLEVSSMNKSEDSLAKDQFFDLPQDIALIEGFAVKSGDFFAVTSSLIVVDPGEKSKNKAAPQNSTEMPKPSTDSFTTDNSTIQTDSTNPYGNPAQNSSTLLEIISRVTTSDSTISNNQSSTSIVTEKGWVGS